MIRARVFTRRTRRANESDIQRDRDKRRMREGRPETIDMFALWRPRTSFFRSLQFASCICVGERATLHAEIDRRVWKNSERLRELAHPSHPWSGAVWSQVRSHARSLEFSSPFLACGEFPLRHRKCLIDFARSRSTARSTAPAGRPSFRVTFLHADRPCEC